MPSYDTPKTIVLSGPMGVKQEALADEVLTPGMLVERDSDGEFAKHSTAGGPASPRFVLENDMTGGGIDDNYAIGEVVHACVLANGSVVNAWLHAGAAAVTIGAALQSAGDGTLEPAAAADNVVATALEAIDNSGGGTAVRLKVEVSPGYVAA